MESGRTAIYRPVTESSGIGWGLLLSSILHLALLLSYYPISLLPFFSVGKRDLNVKLAQASVRVDIVAMPKMTVKELRTLPIVKQQVSSAEAPPAPEVKPLVKQEKAAEQFIKKVKKRSLFDRLKSLSTTRIKEKVKAKKKRAKRRKRSGTGGGISASEQREMKKLLVAGNRLSKGRALVGSATDQTIGEFASYLGDLPDHVRPFWKLPSYLMDQDLTCRIRIYLSSNGELIKSEIFQSSGNSEFDQKAMRAVSRSNPFPILSSHLGPRALRGDIVLGFPL